MKKWYRAPHLFTEKSFETSALGCAKTAVPPPGSHHLTAAYDTFTGHTGTWLGAYPTFFTITANASTGVGYAGNACTSASLDYATACIGVTTIHS
jgi:hypothetical protein